MKTVAFGGVIINYLDEVIHEVSVVTLNDL